jgi:F0F1-type ATP synthase membrane subunit c/vacuolar-type H+-ATPase subunit K
MNSIYSKFSFRTAGVALGVGLATAGLSLVSGVASAATVTSLPDLTKEQFNELNFTELFVAEGRLGNNSLNNAERELGINDKSGQPVQSAQFVWEQGTEYDFTLNYDGSMVNYSVGGTALSSEAFSGSIDTIYIRTNETANSNVRIDSLVFNDEALDAFSEPIDDEEDYLKISDISEEFTLQGKVNFSWTGTQPTRSNLAYQIKVGKPVPEPLTILGSGVALGFGALLKKESSRRQNKVK